MLPFALKITLAILVVLLILLFVAVKKRKFIRLVIILIILDIAFGVWQGLSEYKRTNKDISTVKADVKIVATDLIHQFEISDSTANEKYRGKVVEVTGIVKDVQKDDSGYYTVVLGDTATMSAVRCAMDTIHQLDAASVAPNSSAIVRGNCTGFRKDEMGLGSDVILNRCVIVKKK
jgi:tRNA_anti-like